MSLEPTTSLARPAQITAALAGVVHDRSIDWPVSWRWPRTPFRRLAAHTATNPPRRRHDGQIVKANQWHFTSPTGSRFGIAGRFHRGGRFESRPSTVKIGTIASDANRPNCRGPRGRRSRGGPGLSGVRCPVVSDARRIRCPAFWDRRRAVVQPPIRPTSGAAGWGGGILSVRSRLLRNDGEPFQRTPTGVPRFFPCQSRATYRPAMFSKCRPRDAHARPRAGLPAVQIMKFGGNAETLGISRGPKATLAITTVR
jgi:hypothetical protein